MIQRSPEEATLLERFSDHYQNAQAPVLQKIERHVCGCAYGATSWTTRDKSEWPQ